MHVIPFAVVLRKFPITLKRRFQFKIRFITNIVVQLLPKCIVFFFGNRYVAVGLTLYYGLIYIDSNDSFSLRLRT